MPDAIQKINIWRCLNYIGGHFYYPTVAGNLNISPDVLNNSVGFVSPDGIHTNNIKGFGLI